MAENSTDDNSNLVDMDDLNVFEEAFYGRTPNGEGGKEAPKVDEVDETEDDPLAPEDDIDDSEEEQEEVEAPADDEPKPEAKEKKKSPLQTRIDELVAEAREAQRERDVLKGRIEAMERTREEVKQDPDPEALRQRLPPEAPKPDALDDKGEPIYPLGEFDPRFITDLTRFTIKQETKAQREADDLADKAKAEAERRESIRIQWNEKVDNIQEELPDFREKVGGLVQAFDGVDAQYGDFLATTIMSCDNGPEIMYYLSQNIGEARKIVASGPFAATLEIGRLQARLEKAPPKEEPSNKTKVSEAPEPPTARVRGSGGRFAVSPDTNDLAAFEKEFYKK